MQSSEALYFKVKHVSGRISFHDPVGHSLANPSSSLQAVSIHSCTDKIVCNLVHFAKDPSAIGGESIRRVEEKVISSVLKDR